MKTTIATVLLVTLAAPAMAQQAKWTKPYKTGLDAFNNSRWQEAITNLEIAVAEDSKQEANKVFDTPFRIDYFPFYYLGVSYLRLGRLDKAEENLNRAASGRMPAALNQKWRQAQKELEQALAKRPRQEPSKPEPAKPEPPKPEPAKPGPAKPVEQKPDEQPRNEPPPQPKIEPPPPPVTPAPNP